MGRRRRSIWAREKEKKRRITVAISVAFVRSVGAERKEVGRRGSGGGEPDIYTSAAAADK